MPENAPKYAKSLLQSFEWIICHRDKKSKDKKKNVTSFDWRTVRRSILVFGFCNFKHTDIIGHCTINIQPVCAIHKKYIRINWMCVVSGVYRFTWNVFGGATFNKMSCSTPRVEWIAIFYNKWQSALLRCVYLYFFQSPSGTWSADLLSSKPKGRPVRYTVPLKNVFSNIFVLYCKIIYKYSCVTFKTPQDERLQAALTADGSF